MYSIKFLVILLFSCTAFSLEWSTYQNFPSPALGSFGVVGDALPDGRLLLWNGDEIFLQNTLDADAFTPIASGYSGDPSFMGISPDGHTVVLGSGTGDFFAPPTWTNSLYLFDLHNPQDYSPSSVALVHPHYHGAFLNEALLLVDVGKPDFSGSELAILNLAGSEKKLSAVVTMPAKLNGPKASVVDKPDFSYSGNVTVDRENGIVYVMDANALELRFFLVQALIDAFQAQEMLDWGTDGTLVGQAGTFFSNGVNGVTPNGNLIISGSLGFLQPGGIQIVDASLADPSQASVLAVEDPADSQAFYAAMYSRGANRITANDYVNWYVSATHLNDGVHHSADANQDATISLSELMRVIQFYNVGGFGCVEAERESEDGYQPFPGIGGDCPSHTSDYAPHDWEISLSELLRLIQLYQFQSYGVCAVPYTEDGFCAGE